MNAIEPNWISLLWFAALATVCMIGFLIVAGMFPLHARADSEKSAAATLLVAGNAILLATLLLGTALYGYTELRWSTSVVVAGLVVLFAPGLFEICPPWLRDGRTGLVVLVGLQILALAVLARIASAPWANMS